MLDRRCEERPLAEAFPIAAGEAIISQLAFRPSQASSKAVRECPSARAAKRRTSNDDSPPGKLEDFDQGDCAVELCLRFWMSRIVCGI